MLRVGKYDHKITFVNFGQVSNGSGGYIPEYTDLLTTKADIIQLKQSSQLEQVQLGLPTAYRVRVQKRKGFDPVVGMLVKWNDVLFAIKNTPTVENTRVGQEWIFDIVNDGT